MSEPAITIRLADKFGRELAWMRPRLFRREHQLVLDNEVLAVMHYHGLRTLTVRSATGAWVIRRIGLLGRSAVVVDEPSGRDVLTIRPGRRRGEFVLADGKICKWSRQGFLLVHIRLSDALGTPLVECGSRVSLGRRQGYLNLHPAAPTHPQLDLLALSIWSVVHRQMVQRRRS